MIHLELNKSKGEISNCLLPVRSYKQSLAHLLGYWNFSYFVHSKNLKRCNHGHVLCQEIHRCAWWMTISTETYFKDLFHFNYIHACTHVWGWVCVRQVSMESLKGSKSPRAGVTGCELPNVGGANRTWVLCKTTAWVISGQSLQGKSSFVSFLFLTEG